MTRLLSLLLLTACTSRLVNLKSEVMSADYRADLPALAKLRDEAQAMNGDYLAQYWSAYASWRIAINGAARGMSKEELTANLEQALGGFEKCIAAKNDFADAYAASASVQGWMGRFQPSKERLSKARELAPENPRVLWVLGGVYLFAPPGYGGDIKKAIETYRHMAEAARAEKAPKSAAPDWGLPEAHMSLAYAHLRDTPPDPAAATKEAREALRLVPDWAYVRDILMPQIEQGGLR
jgi:tetratricopeptide (TPR) repeat protein